MARQVDALLRKFRRSFDKPADPALALFGRQRGIKKLPEPADGLTFYCHRVVLDRVMQGRRGRSLQPQLHQLLDRVGAIDVTCFRPGVDRRDKAVRQLHGAARVAICAHRVIPLPDVGHA